jgi:nicotinate-nucleotide--dimethylbenzimidazole phosphoribosyltransferase
LSSSDFWWVQPPAAINIEAVVEAEQRQSMLTKPPGALGRLESLAVRLAGLQGRSRPGIEQIEIVVFAGDHGVVDEGISAFPQVVTYEMIKNFANGGAAINVLAKLLGARLTVVNLGTVVEAGELPGVVNRVLGSGTANMTVAAALTEDQLMHALQTGREQAGGAAQLFIGGDMGIGNTTAAAAVCCALLGVSATQMAGPGTGLDAAGVSHKAVVIERALAHHADHLDTPLDVLQRLGGFEIAALAGAYIHCAQQAVPVLVDGFISSTAALCATRLCAGSEDWFFYSHRSAEPGHATILTELGAEPLLDLGMRLGEGSGAAVAAMLLRQACALHNDMATFAEAGVSEA